MISFTYYAVLGQYGFVGSRKTGAPQVVKSRRTAERIAEWNSTPRYKARVVEFTAWPTGVLADKKNEPKPSVNEEMMKLFPDAFKDATA